MENISLFYKCDEKEQRANYIFGREMERPQVCLMETKTSHPRRAAQWDPFMRPTLGAIYIDGVLTYVHPSVSLQLALLAALSSLAEKCVTSSTDGVWGARSSRVRFMAHLAAPCSWWFRCHNRCSHNSSLIQRTLPEQHPSQSSLIPSRVSQSTSLRRPF